MIEMLAVQDRSTCRHCGRPIVRWVGDLGSDYWSHDDTREKSCNDQPVAEPARPDTEAAEGEK